jgi:hypothetical protein
MKPLIYAFQFILLFLFMNGLVLADCTTLCHKNGYLNGECKFLGCGGAYNPPGGACVPPWKCCCFDYFPCDDTDGGSDIYTYGTCIDPYIYGIMPASEDFCYVNQDGSYSQMLNEMYCTTEHMCMPQTKYCPSGYVCDPNIGACVLSVATTTTSSQSTTTSSQSTTTISSGACSDSGNDYFRKDTCTDALDTYDDSCVNSDILCELVCTGDWCACTQYDCPNGCLDGACIGGAVTTTTIEVADECSPGDYECVGVNRRECEQSQEGNYVLVNKGPSESCCSELGDGDCSSSECAAQGGDWLGSSSFDPLLSGLCCGDDMPQDLGRLMFDELCIRAGWTIGEEGERYEDNRLVFCDGQFRVCYDATDYEEVYWADHCENFCGFYCEPQFDRWLSSTAPEGLDILSEPLGDGEAIDTQKPDLGGGYGCCPSTWCWNSTKCIENQIDESGNLQVYSHPVTGQDYRCEDGSWDEAELVHTWNYHLRGYCPELGGQCLVSHASYEANNNPEAYYTEAMPQCIADGQWLLDYYCNGSVWVSRTALVATKLLQLADARNTEFELFCDTYESVLNDYQYEVGSRQVFEYLRDEGCERGNKQFRCANNPCVLRDLQTGRRYVGVSVNVDLFDEAYGLADALYISGCEQEDGSGPWEYVSCGENAIFNPLIQTIVYSDEELWVGPQVSGWDVFMELISNPADFISSLIYSGQLGYYSITGIQLEFSVFGQSRLFSKLYVSQTGLGRIEASLEEDKHDWESGNTEYYMHVNYIGFDQDICNEVNDFTLAFNRLNCNTTEDGFVVADSRGSKSYLMGYWPDLTSKLLPFGAFLP